MSIRLVAKFCTASFVVALLGLGSIFVPCKSTNRCMKVRNGIRACEFFDFTTTPIAILANPVISMRSGISFSDPYKERELVRTWPMELEMSLKRSDTANDNVEKEPCNRYVWIV